MADVTDAPAKAVGGAGNVLTKKVGPLPLGVWVILIGGTIVIVYAVNAKGGSKAGSGNVLAVADDGTTGPESATGDGSVGGWQYQQAAAAVAAKTYSTNEQWGRAAISALIGDGYDAALADVAIRRYLGGLAISVQQRPLVTRAIELLGPTPQSLGPVDELPTDSPVTGGGGTTPNTPPPTPPRNNGGLFGWIFGLVDVFLPGLRVNAQNLQIPVNGQNYSVDLGYGEDGGSVTVTDPNGNDTTVSVPRGANPATTTPAPTTGNRTYTVKDGDTLPSIAMAVYGSSLQASKIYNANLSKISDKDNLVAGTVLVIPE